MKLFAQSLAATDTDMKRDYNTGEQDDVIFFEGIEVEHTPAFGMQTLFVTGVQPFEQILANAGESKMSWILSMNNHNEEPNLVPNIEEGGLIDAYNSGIIDPTKVVRSAIENAAAAAVTLLMTECVIHNKPSDKKADAGMDMGMMGM